MKIGRGSRGERFDVVCYAPWAASLVGGTTVELQAAGAENQLLLLASGLAQRGLRVGMIVMGAAGELPTEVSGVRIIPQARRRRSQGLLARVALAFGAFRSMLSVRTDLLVQRNAGPTTGVAALVARLRGERFVYSSASLGDFKFAGVERRGVNVRLYEWGVRSASDVVVQTEEQARLCHASFGREPVVIRSIAERSEPRRDRPEAFIWAGRLGPEKRPDRYLDLARAVPEGQFWMIALPGGSAELRRQVTEAVHELPNLELLPPRSKAGVGRLLDRSVAVVNTSDREGMPNVFLEGWSRGVPALALAIDPDDLITRHGLGSFASGDPERFEEQARRLWRERDDQAELAERCVAYVRAEHDEGAVVDRWVSEIVRAS